MKKIILSVIFALILICSAVLVINVFTEEKLQKETSTVSGEASLDDLMDELDDDLVDEEDEVEIGDMI